VDDSRGLEFHVGLLDQLTPQQNEALRVGRRELGVRPARRLQRVAASAR